MRSAASLLTFAAIRVEIAQRNGMVGRPVLAGIGDKWFIPTITRVASGVLIPQLIARQRL